MKYSSSQARKLAQQLRDRFGVGIHEATWGTIVPADFLASLISVEAGKDSRGQIKEDATRFEPHVYTKLKQVRDGKLLQYNKIRRAQLADASDDALKALATSCGLTQIMQWWSIHLGISVAELRGPNHLKHAVKLLEMTAGNQLRTLDYEGTLRIWNTGRLGGKTHDADYVTNAGAVMDAYAELGPIQTKASPDKVEPFKPEPEKPDSPTEQTAPQINVEHAGEVNATPQPIEGGRKNDPPMQASQGGKKSTIAVIFGAIGSIWTGFQGWFQNSSALKITGILCLTAVILAWMFRQLIMDYVRMNYMSDPARLNVK